MVYYSDLLMVVSNILVSRDVMVGSSIIVISWYLCVWVLFGVVCRWVWCSYSV